MPIVNGQYVYDTLDATPTYKNQSGWINQAFGEGKFSKGDWSDVKTAAYNYLLKQQEQAYNLELWNYQNAYNSPAEQMKRYQDAGLNPNLIYQQQNTASAPASASASPFRSGGVMARRAQNAINAIGQIMNIVKAARETYDYMRYGREEHAWERNLTMQRSQGQALENYWNSYLLGMDNQGENSPIPGSPRARMYQYQLDTQEQRYLQLKAVVSSIPDQQARTRALKALDDYRLQIMRGQYGALMQIDTGSSGLDSFLRMLGFYLLGK